MQAAGKHAEAIAQFDQALAKKLEGADAAAQRMTISLDKAVSLAATKKAAEGIKMVEEVIKQAPDENLELHARAYNALGNCYLAAGQKKSALIAFLHVDLLFSGFAEQHAEALYNLATLWRDEEKAERGKQAADQLKREYPGSRWASK
jgi:tetratricopeptide (TPR) repeat protein